MGVSAFRRQGGCQGRWWPVLTISSGHSASYLTDAVAKGRENYYTGAVAAGEPPGRWYGAGAAALGLHGEVDTQDMRAVYERFLDPRDPQFRDPAQWEDVATLGRVGRRYVTEDELFKAALDAEPSATPERQAEMRLDAGKRARKNVAFLDATFSVQKSVTVLHAAFEAQEVAARNSGDPQSAEVWAAHRAAVEEAIWAGNRAGLDHLAVHAGYSRVGHHGGAAGRFIDAHAFVIASFFQHDSRDHDPQLHIHNAILNRVEGADGEWRTLDSRAMHRFRGAASAVAERTTEAHLTRTLGVRFATRPDGKAREIVGVRSEAISLFSSRRRAITAATKRLVAAFEEQFDRQPTALELDRLQRQATFATRRAKAHEGEELRARLERWDRQLRAEVAGGLAQVAAEALACAGNPPEPTAWARSTVIETALADLQERASTWNAPDLTRALSDALPDHVGTLSGEDFARLLDALTQDALAYALPVDATPPGREMVPEGLRLQDGRPAYEVPGGARYTTPAHLAMERDLAVSAGHACFALRPETVEKFLIKYAGVGQELGADQVAAVRGVLTSGSQVETLIGPAGTGKSFVVGVIARAWCDPDSGPAAGRVIGLATSQIATEVLVGEGLTASNVTRWLNAQRRLDDCASHDLPPEARDASSRLTAQDLVVVDESAMADTADLAEVYSYVQRAGAKLLLVGDHRQLTAVGAGGGMDLVATTGRSYELTEARRFAEAWESGASLRLRVGNPDALQDYLKHGRLRDCGTTQDAERSATRAWLADTLAGRHAVLVVDTNEQTARLNAELRADLVRLGQVRERGVRLDLEGTEAGVGDLIQARSNGWHLAGFAGNRRGPINRERLRVLSITADGGLLGAPVVSVSKDGETLGVPIRLPASYVAKHVSLGYAVTAHAAQGITVDTAHLVTTPATAPTAIYVGLTRGRHSNTAHVTTITTSAAAAPGSRADSLYRNPAAALAVAFETQEPERAALISAAESLRAAGSVRTAVELMADAAEIATAGRTTAWLDELVAGGDLNVADRKSLAAEEGAATLSRLLRRVELAGHSPYEVLRTAITLRSFGDARQLTSVLQHRIVSAVPLDPIGSEFGDWIPDLSDASWQDYFRELAAVADARARHLGKQCAAEPPAWAVEAFGPVPAEPRERDRWVSRAAVVAAHRELTGHDDPASALGAAPRPGQPEVSASWRAAWRALGRDESARAEAEMSDGQLRVRIRAWDREQIWAPRYVADDLAATSEAAATRRGSATLRRAEAQASGDRDERSRLIAEADQAEALAATLDRGCMALREADSARALWYAHTAETRAAAERAAAELASRRASDDVDDRLVTAEQWLAEQRATHLVEDRFREIGTEADLADERWDVHPATTVPAGPPQVPVAKREPEAESELGQGVGLTAAEIAEVLTRARAALSELELRRVVDAAREADELRVRQIAQWVASDQAHSVGIDAAVADRSGAY